ncbi:MULTISPECIES: hypothetical protein [Dyella]|uniref:Uncharacterized protein n=2 Tax=Dyella TaxID=231454 RepID=A0A4R0YXZ1_9GAMM|nr:MULTISPECIES: hypothetical protein [Dyella]TBR40550.1 hypothetical protein EYV96_10475 [Dyella terrae]TCI11868.1 hypothetical protein EZM97_00395 [Dyella soli]
MKAKAWRSLLMSMMGGWAIASTVVAGPGSPDQETGQSFVDLRAFEAALTHEGHRMGPVSSGNLEGFGQVSVVVVKGSVDSQAQQIVVLAEEAGGLRIAAQTPFADSSDVDTSLRVERGSLFVQLEGLKGVWGTYQFKRQTDGTFRLIGIRLHRAEDSGEPDHDIKSVVDTDFNVVTGMMRFKRVGDTRPLTARVHGAACYFQQFDFDYYTCAKGMKTDDGKAADVLMNAP